MIEKFKIDNGVNEYATLIEPTEEERKQLISEGYQPWSRYQSRNPEHYGKENTTFTVQPWEKYEPYCPHGQPIVYVKERQEGR